MQSTLPEFLDFAQKARLGCEIRGQWPVSKLERVIDLLADDSGNLEAQMQFAMLDRLHCVTGEASVNLKLTCQRCMQPEVLPLAIKFKLVLLSDEAKANQVPEDYESLLVKDSILNVPQMLEDELLLAMPLVVTHNNDCSDYLKNQTKDNQNSIADEGDNPFSILKDLL